MKKDHIIAGLFITVLFSFLTAGLLLPERGFSPSENRYLAKKPEFTVQKLLKGSYGEEYERYLSDQFPLRDRFVTVKANTERLLLKTDVNGIFFGKNNYYIERFDTEELVTEQLTKNLEALSGAADQLAGRVGAERVKIMLVPSASQVLKSKLPAFAAPADQSLITDRLRQMLREPSMLLAAEQALSAHETEPIYYKTDHHWTSLGAFYAYRLYAEAAGFTPWEDSAFYKETAAGDFYGTIQSKLNTGMEPDEITLYMPKREQKYRVYYDGLPKAFDTLYSERALEGKDKYAVFLDGNHGLTKIVNDTAAVEEGAGRRLMILKDSFAHSFAPFAANHFEEVHMVDLRYFNMDIYDYMQTQQITDVLVLYQIPGFASDNYVFKMNGR